MKSDKWLAYLCFLGLPLLAIGFITFCAYRAAVANGFSPVVAIILGIVGGTLFVGAMIASSGNDMMDFAVTSIIVIVLTVILLPVFMRARENAQKRAGRQWLREQKALVGPHPQAPNNAPQSR